MSKFKPDEIVVCAIPHFREDQSGGRHYKRWQHVRGDDPGVKAHPDWFLPKDLATDSALSQIASENFNATMARAYARPVDVKVNPPAPKPIAVEDQRVCIRRVNGADGVLENGQALTVLPGQVLSKSALPVKTFPDSFRPVNPKRLDPREAVVATADLVVMGREGKEARRVYAGEWIAIDDPLTEIHPNSFVGAPYRTGSLVLSSYVAE